MKQRITLTRQQGVMDEYIETVGEDFGLKVIETKYHTAVMRFRCLVH